MKEIHDAHHRNMLRRRNPVDLWGDALVNAWAAESLLCHPAPDKATIAGIVNWLRKAVAVESLEPGRDIAAAAFYARALHGQGKINEAGKVAKAVSAALAEAERREAAGSRRFSVFNSPECVFATSACMASLEQNGSRKLLLERIDANISRLSENRPTRVVLFSAAAFELGEPGLVTDPIRRFTSTLDVFSMERPDFVFTFWFWTRYAARLNEMIDDPKRVTELGSQLRERVAHWWEYEGSSLSAGQEPGLSPLEAVLLDEALARASGSEPFTPLQLFDALHLHPAVVEASRPLFASGHYAQSIFEAFKRVNNEVKVVSGVHDKDLRDLMAHVFSERNPAIRLNQLGNQSDQDEQEGFKLIYMGSMQGIRNPKAHDAVVQNDPYKTLEYLGLASLLLKMLDERVSP